MFHFKARVSSFFFEAAFLFIAWEVRRIYSLANPPARITPILESLKTGFAMPIIEVKNFTRV